MKKLFIFLILICITFAQSTHPWPQFHGSAQHGGQSQYNTSHIDGTIKWVFETGSGIESSPVIAEDGTIYFGSHDGYLYAINPDGTEKWKFFIGTPNYDVRWNVSKVMMATPAITQDGTIYAYSASNYLYAVNPDGTEKWKFYIEWLSDFWSSPTIGDDGTIYIGSARADHNPNFESGLYAINPNGTEKWHTKFGTGVTTTPSISNDGNTIYIGIGVISLDKTIEDAGQIVALTKNGAVKWKFDVKLWVEGPSTIGSDGIIYTGTKEGDIYAINPDGTEKWRFSTTDGVSASPAISHDGSTIYVGSWDTYMYALDSNDGTLKWKFKTPDAFEGITSSAVISSDGTIYFGSNSGMFYAFNPDGTEKWNFINSLGSGTTSPAIGPDGTIYFASWNKNFYAIGGSEQYQTNDELIENETVDVVPEPTEEPEILSEIQSNENTTVININSNNSSNIIGSNESADDKIVEEKTDNFYYVLLIGASVILVYAVMKHVKVI
ncbi:MAG: PQQ-binding-like beta-propeller repeat protein [Candidatus Micrarchaeota archaeon]